MEDGILLQAVNIFWRQGFLRLFGLPEVRATSGDPRLGGEDFDQKLVAHLTLATFLDQKLPAHQLTWILTGGPLKENGPNQDPPTSGSKFIGG